MTLIESLELAGVDTKTTLYRFGGNAALLERFIRKFPQDGTYAQLGEAARERRYGDVERLAHTLKGTSANLGYDQLSRHSAALVSAVRDGSTDRVEELFAPLEAEYQKVVSLIAQID